MGWSFASPKNGCRPGEIITQLEYRLYDNEYLFSRRWKNQELINAFYARKEYLSLGLDAL